MKYEVKFTNQFKKDLKLAKKQNKDLDKLYEVIGILAANIIQRAMVDIKIILVFRAFTTQTAFSRLKGDIPHVRTRLPHVQRRLQLAARNKHQTKDYVWRFRHDWRLGSRELWSIQNKSEHYLHETLYKDIHVPLY